MTVIAFLAFLALATLVAFLWALAAGERRWRKSPEYAALLSKCQDHAAALAELRRSVEALTKYQGPSDTA